MYTSHRALGLSMVLAAALCATVAWAAPPRVTGVSASRNSCSAANVSWNGVNPGDDGAAIKGYCVRHRSVWSNPAGIVGPGPSLQYGGWIDRGCGTDPDQRARTIGSSLSTKASVHFQVRAKDENNVHGPWSGSSSNVRGC